MSSLICAWTKGWSNHRDTGDLIRHRAHYDVTVMVIFFARNSLWFILISMSHLHFYPAFSIETQCYFFLQNIEVDLLTRLLVSESVFLYARLKKGRIMPWQCPSVCPSVRPSVRLSFPDFFQHALRYQFETWFRVFSRLYDMSSFSFITIGSLWPSLQPKVGQTPFLQSWPYNPR